MKKFFKLIILLFLLASCSGVRQYSGEGQKVLIFTHAAIINTSGGENQSDMTVIITGGRIADIQKSGKGRSPKGAKVIDASGKFLIPGLWDMHVHGSDARYYPLYIVNGVTGVRNMWGNPDLLEQRKEISKGNLIGPRLIIASPIIDGPNPVWPGSIIVSNKTEAVQTVRHVKEMGYDFVKGYELLPREAYFAIADESKKQGMPFVNHIPVFISAVEASNAGQASIEHLAFLTDGILTGAYSCYSGHSVLF